MCYYNLLPFYVVTYILFRFLFPKLNFGQIFHYWSMNTICDVENLAQLYLAVKYYDSPISPLVVVQYNVIIIHVKF